MVSTPPKNSQKNFARLEERATPSLPQQRNFLSHTPDPRRRIRLLCVLVKTPRSSSSLFSSDNSHQPQQQWLLRQYVYDTALLCGRHSLFPSHRRCQLRRKRSSEAPHRLCSRLRSIFSCDFAEEGGQAPEADQEGTSSSAKGPSICD
jgi:hypothetical protein